MWYHVSKEFLGKEKIFTPRLPRDGDNFIVSREGNIPRICVSSSILNCIKAIHGINNIDSYGLLFKENPCVYFTEETPFVPPDTVDFRENDERWFIKKTKFFYLGRVDMYKLFIYRKIVPTETKELKLPKQPKRIYEVKECFMEVLLKELSSRGKERCL